MQADRVPDEIGQVSMVASAADPKLIDERTHGSTVSQLEGGLGPEDLARTLEERQREERRPDNAAGRHVPYHEDPSTGLATGRHGMHRLDGTTIADLPDSPSTIPEPIPTPPTKHPESF